MKKIFLFLLYFISYAGYAQLSEYDEKTWSLQMGFGRLNFADNRATGDNAYWGEDEANLFYLNTDFFLSPRFALTGGVYWEQDGLMTAMASGIGIKKYNQLGIQAGGKFYFFPKHWFVQPHIGGLLITNFGYLKHYKGGFDVPHIESYPDNSGIFKYDIHCPAFSIAPHIGIDLHLFPSLSLTFDYDYRFGWWGKSRGELTITQGNLSNTRFIDERKPYRGGFSFGLKMDFPIHPASPKNGKVVTNLMDLILCLF